MTDAQPAVTLTHPFALLAEPAFGAPVLALLAAGDRLRAGSESNGCLAVSTSSGAAGYVPAMLCAAGEPASWPAPRDIRVVLQTTLFHSPQPGAQYGARWLVGPSEPLQILEEAGMFRKIQRPNGQVGYVPATLCRTTRTAHGHPTACQLAQTVALYRTPTPGGQFESHWRLDPIEPLIELGRGKQFVLVQRENGELGYVPAALCGDRDPEAILPLGRIDLGWIAVGGGWGIVNWAGVAVALAQLNLLDTALRPYVGLSILLGVAAALWLIGRKPLLARSFAIGVLLAYALLHFSSNGIITLWR
jgi:SH3-like domain-containing protein